MAKFLEAVNGMSKLFDAVPKGKWDKVSNDAVLLETYVRQSAALLNNLRRYFLDTTGEQSPFVAEIDELVHRKS